MAAQRSRNPILIPGGADRLHEGCCVLAIISKAPQAGKVKTRLIPPLTPEQAADLHAAFLKDMSSTIALCANTAEPRSARPLAVQGGIVYTPVGAEHIFNELLPQDFFLLAQGAGDLGERLSKAVGDLLSLGAASVCLLNSDSPTLPVAALRNAVRALAAHGDRVVLGPAEDGGYYLIGLKLQHRALFERIAWSTDVVLAQTIERAAEIGLPVELLETWFDVDDKEGLNRLMRPSAADKFAEASGANARRLLREFFPFDFADTAPQLESSPTVQAS